jgi:hypothetical protein
MDARYINATTVGGSKKRVAGYRLLPFCLRHRVLLEAIDSPFLKPLDRVITAYDIILAAKVLSTYDKNVLNEELGWRDRLRIKALEYGDRIRGIYAGYIYGHIVNGCSYPKTWKQEGIKNEKIPWVLSCVANNVRNGFSLEEAWTMPEGEAVWFGVCHALYNGSKIEVLSTDEEKALESFDDIVNAFKEKETSNAW